MLFTRTSFPTLKSSMYLKKCSAKIWDFILSVLNFCSTLLIFDVKYIEVVTAIRKPNTSNNFVCIEIVSTEKKKQEGC